MGDPAGDLSWQVDTGELGSRGAKALREAVDAVAHWLELWRGLVAAAVAPSVHFTFAATRSSGNAVAVTVGPEDGQVHISVPETLVQSGAAALRTELLSRALAAVEKAAQRWPPEIPPQIWHPGEDPQPDDVDPLATTLEVLEPEELVLLGRLDGTSSDELARFHELDEYIIDRIEQSGVAEVSDTEAGCSDAAWIVELIES